MGNFARAIKMLYEEVIVKWKEERKLKVEKKFL
jgi:hypothetical protein